jgi:electron transport complex protein RnfA
LITTNCAVLGVAIIVVTKEFTFSGTAAMLNLPQALVYAASMALGFGLALIIFAGLREHMDLVGVPKPFKGVPIALITAGILALAFMGFSGIV